MNPQTYYRSQSEISDPGDYAYLFDALQDDLTSLCRAVRNVYIHYRAGNWLDIVIPQERLVEVDTRYCSRILKRVLELDPRPLTEERPPEKRFVGCCRDASLLLCAMLRHKGIPARLRYGFASYFRPFGPDFSVDHVVVDRYDGTGWKLVDPERYERTIDQGSRQVDTQDIPRDPQAYLSGGATWEHVRDDGADPMNYGVVPDVPHLRGMPMIQGVTVIDIAMLNKQEMLLWDSWGLAFRAEEPTGDDLALLERAAQLSAAAHDDAHFEAIRLLYQDARLNVPPTFTSYSPVQERQSVTL